MVFLKCNSCNELNEVKTEYLVFCSKCNSKLDNNYSNWKKNNSEKYFEDFKKTVCISQDEVQSQKAKESPSKGKPLKYWLSFVVVFAFFYAISYFAGEKVIQYLKSEKTPEAILNKNWVKETYGSYGLAIETPEKLMKADLPFPDRVKRLIESMETYNYMKGKGFKIMVNTIRYKPEVGTASLEGAANGAINEIKAQDGVNNFDYSENEISNGEIPGLIQNGKYKHKSTNVEFVNIVFAKELTLWQITILYPEDDKVGRIAAKRVVDSINIGL